MDDTRIELLRIPDGPALDQVRPGERRRAWMDETPGAFAYRCLPLTMANLHGWEVLCPLDVSAEWDGGQGADAITLTGADPDTARISSHFGSGILTFEIRLIVRTPPGTHLWLTGPPNRPKDAIQPLSGLIETDWMPFTFTMNWKFTRANTPVRFKAGEPIAFFFPLNADAIQAFQPTLGTLSSQHPDFGQYKVAHTKRGAFDALREQHGVEVEELRFQGWYMRGEVPDGSAKAPAHRAALNVKPVREAQ